MSDTRPEHDLVHVTRVGDLPETRYLCVRCELETVGVKPTSACPGVPPLPLEPRLPDPGRERSPLPGPRQEARADRSWVTTKKVRENNSRQARRDETVSVLFHAALLLFIAIANLRWLLGWRDAFAVVISAALVVRATLLLDRLWSRRRDTPAQSRWLCSACGARGECETPEVAAAALAEHRRTSGCPGAAL